MLFFMVFLIFCKVTIVTNKNAGSAIFNRSKLNLNCWSRDDIAKLQARKAFEELVPPPVNPERVNSQYIQDTIKYFKNALIAVQSGVDRRTADILKEALSDTIGAHLKSEILPSVRFAYYAGYIPYRSAKDIHTFFEQIKIYLNTQGVGWKRPARIPEWSNLTVAKISIGFGKLLDPCACLVTIRDSNNCIHLPSPRLDDKREPSAIALPFRSEGLVSLMSPFSENILLKYYTTAARCILHSSPAKCRHPDFVSFNNELWHWMKRDVAPHLVDEKLFAAYGGVLRIGAAVQNYGKGLSRRNLFEFQEAAVSKWNPWRTFSESYIYINADWTPALYIALVLLTAVAICLLQICYNYMFGDVNACNCKSTPNKSYSKDIAYSKVDSNFPAVLPRHSEIFYENQKQTKRSPKPPSIVSIKTQTVYDFNENREKIMEVLESENDVSEDESTTTNEDSEDVCQERKSKGCAAESRPKSSAKCSPKSPPKIDVAQLTMEKPRSLQSKLKDSKPMYSTSTLTRSESHVTFFREGHPSESAWSGTSSTTSGKSVTSASSKSRTPRSRSSRDLAWAHHVISRHTRRSAQSSGTEQAATSFLTPPSRR